MSAFNGVPNPPTMSTRHDLFTNIDTINLNFMTSVLARFGYLLTPRDLVYGIIGWTYGGFDTTLGAASGNLDPAFGAHGLTLGAGWERRLADFWSLRLEYRYTRFENVTLTQSQVNSQFFSGATSASNTASSTTISPDLHVVRFGLSHYFGQEASVLTAYNAYKAPPVQQYSWTGYYIGFSVGAGGMRSNATSSLTSFSPSTRRDLAGTILDTSSELITDNFSGGSQFKPGGTADLFVGYNQQINNWIFGSQIEGSVARFNEKLHRSGSDVSFDTSQTFTLGVPDSAPSISGTTSSGTRDDFLSINWMATAAVRLGYLVSPRDLLYGIGGWTVAGFSTTLESDNGSNRTFTANGPTIGIGWERQLPSMWTFRAEYRYTSFLDTTLRIHGTTTLSSSSTGNTDLQTFTVDSSSKIINDMHIFRLGVARAFAL